MYQNVKRTCRAIVFCLNLFVGFTLQAKLVSSRHLIQVHLKISSRGLENLASQYT